MTMEEVFFPSGCAALYRREMLDEVGLFDEDFFAYGDDTDLGLKGRLAGWKCLYVPKAIVYHRYSQSSGAYSALKAFYVERNRVWIAVKYFPLSLLLESPFYTFAALCLSRVWRPGRPWGSGTIQRSLFSRATSANPIAGLPGGLPGVAENVEEEKGYQTTDPGKRKRNQELVSPFWHERPGDLLERLKP